MQQGVKVLQQKLAAVIQELAGSGVGGGGGGADDRMADAPDAYAAARSPEPDRADYGIAQGYTTPAYGNGGAGSVWGGGATPYGATPYGQSGNPW